MKPTFLCFLFVLLPALHVQIVKSQRLTSKQMLSALDKFDTSNYTEEIKKCSSLMSNQLYPDVNFLYMFCDTTPIRIAWRQPNIHANCAGYQCWESHLTDATRFSILHVMNTYRTLVSEGHCGPRCKNYTESVIFELRWNSKLENQAMLHQAKFCGDTAEPTSALETHGLKYLDNVTVTFEVKEGFQREFRLILRTLVAENHLNDWDESTNQFRRGLAIEVGCAYLLKYNVTMKTTLNQTVISGNVGHFSCVFGSTKPFNPKTLPILETSEMNCSSAIPELNSELSTDFLHRSLCTVPLELFKTEVNCQIDKEYAQDLFNNVCPKGAFKNPGTWEEKMFGLTVRLVEKPDPVTNQLQKTIVKVECNKPNLPETLLPEEGDNHNYNCTREHEVDNNADPNSCVTWNCKESQLGDMERHLIWHTINRAVEMIAQGICTDLCKSPCACNGIQYCNMMERSWHWYLELKAAEKLRNCPTDNSFKQVEYPHPPFNEPIVFEEVVLLIHVLPREQQNLHDRFADLFWSNAFHDWDEDGTFRRGNTFWMGCAIVVRSPRIKIDVRPEFKLFHGLPAHLACIFATTEKKFKSMVGDPTDERCCINCTEPSTDVPCSVQTAKNSVLHPHLCSSTKTLAITMNCAVNKCHKQPNPLTDWTKIVPGFTLIRYVNGSFEYVYRPPAADKRTMLITSKMCCIATLLFGIAIVMVLLVISLIYKHSETKKYQEIAELRSQENLKDLDLSNDK